MRTLLRTWSFHFSQIIALVRIISSKAFIFLLHISTLSRSLTLLLILFSYERDKSQDFRMALAARSQMKDRVTLFIFFLGGIQ